MIKNLPDNVGDPDSAHGSERSPGEGNGDLLQYSCLEKSNGQRNLLGYSLGDRKDVDTTEQIYYLMNDFQKHFPYIQLHPVFLSFSCGSAGKESASKAGDLSLIPGLGKSTGEGKGYPLQYSGLENSMDCIVYGVAKNWA